MKETYHWLSRDERIEFIKKEIDGGKSYKTFYWDRHHPKGPEVHIITTTGIIVVKNYYTRKLVTVLIARPGQIKRYFDMWGRPAPKWLLDIAQEHYIKGYNKR